MNNTRKRPAVTTSPSTVAAKKPRVACKGKSHRKCPVHSGPPKRRTSRTAPAHKKSNKNVAAKRCKRIKKARSENEYDASGEDGDSHSEDEERQNVKDLHELEESFVYILALYKQERLAQIQDELNEIEAGTSKEYLKGMEAIEATLNARQELSQVSRRFRLSNLANKYEAEKIAIQQNYQSQRQLLYDDMKAKILRKIKRLEAKRPRKAVPALVYQLPEAEIEKDARVVRIALDIKNVVDEHRRQMTIEKEREAMLGTNIMLKNQLHCK